MSLTNTKKERINFFKLPFDATPPDLLTLQRDSFAKLFQIGNIGVHHKRKSRLYEIFGEYFPVFDVKGNFVLEFLGYTISPPLYTPEECLQKGISYDVSLKIRLRITCKDNQGTNVVEDEVYLANIPYMTPQCSFIFKGIERVVISQLQRSFGVFFVQNKHPSGINLYSAKIIPVAGTWIEFALDIYNVMYVYLDRRKKVPVTLLLRAMGYGTDKDIVQLFDLAEEIEITKATNLSKYKGRVLAGNILETWEEDLIDEESDQVTTIIRHKVVVERNTVLDDNTIDKIVDSRQRTIMLLKEDMGKSDFSFIYHTLQKDHTNSAKEAIDDIYYQFRSNEPSDEQVMQDFFKQLLFSAKRGNVGRAGRHCLNRKLNLSISKDNHLLTQEDIIATIKIFPDLISGKRSPEDLDSLVNRIVCLSGDLLEQALIRGIKFTVHHAKQILSFRSDEDLGPPDIINGNYILSSINAFFGLDPNSQFMDQVNPLSELEHKRRLTKISKSLTRGRAGSDVRDIHPTHFGKICPVATPEGSSIGLTNHYSLYARVNELGVLEAPYRRVENGLINLKDIYYLTSEDEDKKIITQYSGEISKTGKIRAKKVSARNSKGEIIKIESEKVDYISLRNDQAFSVATSLSPFVENTDASRATMGSNMQRQAVPLLRAQVPIVGTGMEKRVAKDSRVLLTAEKEGVVEYVDAKKIIIRYNVSPLYKDLVLSEETKTYHISKLRPTNQGICINYYPIVAKGDKVTKGQYLCEGYSIKDGELALGSNLRVAFVPWRGYSFEDSIVISERLVKEDILTSLHIEEYKVDLYSTKLGPEEFTADIPGVSEEAISNLDKNGIVRVGQAIKEGDILVGKITPQSNENLSSESKLMAAIFGNLASSVKDTSFRTPFASKGTVISTQILYGYQHDGKKPQEMKKQVESLQKNIISKMNELRNKAVQKLIKLIENQKITGVRTLDNQQVTTDGALLTEKQIKEKIFLIHKSEKGIEYGTINTFATCAWTKDAKKNKRITFLVSEFQSCYHKLISSYLREKKKIQLGDGLPPGVLKQAKIHVLKKCKIEVGDKLSGRHGNKGVISKIAPEEDMPYHADGTRVDIVLNPLGIPSRMNVSQLKDTILAWAGDVLGVNYAMPIFEGASLERINEEMVKAKLPEFGRTTLYDGLTGKPFDQKVTCGILYMLKLNHLVAHKIHARATGPYALVTQQPLGGRSRKGGQRVGEMEVWSTQAHGAAHTLLEFLTVKSDDVEGRRKTQEAIYKGTPLPSPSIPESLKILEQTLFSLLINLRFL